MKNKTYKIISIISFSLSLISLVIGAFFHDFRSHPENVGNYNLGVTMGITMISLFVAFFLVGIAFLVIYKKRKK